MKRPLFVLGALITGMFVFSSCNKDLKDDVKELRNLLGTDEPITVTTQLKDRNNIDRTITETYKFKSSGSSTQALVKQPNGNYEIYIERFSDVSWEESAFVSFSYNPTTKEITNKRGGHYWDDFGNYNSQAYYNENQYNTGLTFNINLKSIDLTSGAISLDVEMAGNEEYSNNVYEWNVPRQGAAVNTKFSFQGKLRIYEGTEQPE